MSQFAQLLQQPINTTPLITLDPQMGGVFALSEHSRDLDAVQSAANHNFRVKMAPVYVVDGREIPDKYTAINTSDGSFLGGGVVSNIYTPCQPDTLYGLAQHLLDLDQSMTVTDIFTLESMIGLQINKGEWSPTGEYQDRLLDNILLLTGFDGRTSTAMRTSSFRPFCSNQYSGTRKVFNIRNTTNAPLKIEQVKSYLSNVNAEIDKTNSEIQSLVGKAMDSGQASRWFTDLLLKGQSIDDLSKRAATNLHNNVDEFDRLLHKGAGCEAGEGTRYAAFNALTNYCTHSHAPANAPTESTAQWRSTTFGAMSVLSGAGFDQLVNK